MSKYILIVFLSFLPLGATLLVYLSYLYYQQKNTTSLRKIIHNTSLSQDEQTLLGIQKQQLKTAHGKFSAFIKEQNAKINLLGLSDTYRYESVMIFALIVFVVCAILAKVIFKAGFVLMLYLGIIGAVLVFTRLNSKLNNQKEQLSIEFMQKVSEIQTYIGIGKSMQNAIDECIHSGRVSKALIREFQNVKVSLSVGNSLSESFLKMYETLQIPEIKTFAQTLSVFEETGGDSLLKVLKSNEHFFRSRMEIKNSQKVYIAQMKLSQKFVIGIPLVLIIGMFILNPSFFGSFYSTFVGELVAIVSISVLLIGIYFSMSIAKIK